MNSGIGQAVSARRVGLTAILIAGVIAVLIDLALHFHWGGIFLPWGGMSIFHAVVLLVALFLAWGGGLTARIAGAVFLVILVFVAGATYIYGAIAQVSGLGFFWGPLFARLAPVLVWQYVLLLLVAGGLFLSGSGE